MRLSCALILVFFSCTCFAQQDKKVQSDRSNNAILITQTVVSKDDSPDISRTLYVVNGLGDSLAVYKVTGSVVEPLIVYCTAAAKQNEICLISNPSDSLVVRFNDKINEAFVGNDKYDLYPQYYNQLKQAVLVNHSVMAVLSLLEDNLGEYTIATILPLLQFASQVNNKRIRTARVETYRSQADDVMDTWHCAYRYNKSGVLESVIAASGKLIRFQKKMSYRGAIVSMIKIYRNIEDRQITDRTLTNSTNNRSILKWRDIVLETGKNRQTILTTTLKKQILSPVKNIIMQPADVLSFISQTPSSK